MARTTIPVTSLAKNAGAAMATAESATAVDQTNGMAIAGANPEKLLLRVTNTAGAAHGVIIRAGNSLYPAVLSGQGDLNVQVAATTGVAYVGPFDSERFLQSDGSLNVDFEASFAGKIAAVLLP